MDSAENRLSNGGLLFDAAEMLRYFGDLDELLDQMGVVGPLHLVIVGGAVIATKDDLRISNDVDVVSDGMTAELRDAVAAISQQHGGLRNDWLNDGAKLKRVALPMDLERVHEGKILIIDSAGSRYVLAMKLVSGRPIDETDCELLIRELNIRHESELLDLIEEAVPERLRTPAMEYFATERLGNAYRRPLRRRVRRWRRRRSSLRVRRRRRREASPSVPDGELINATPSEPPIVAPARTLRCGHFGKISKKPCVRPPHNDRAHRYQ